MSLYINGERIDQASIDDEIQRLRPSYERAFADQSPGDRQRQLAEWSRENVIEAVIFRQEAHKAYPVIDDRLIEQTLGQLLAQEGEDGPIRQQLNAGQTHAQALRDQLADQIRHDQLMQKLTSDIADPTDKQVAKYYEQNIERFTVPEMVHAAHIVKHPGPQNSPEQVQMEMEKILDQLNSGTPFEDLAAKHSDCPDNAGDLGFFARGKMVQAFEDVAFDLEPGQYSGVFLSEFGAHIAKVYEKRPPAPCPIEQVREVIMRDLKQQAQEKAVEQFLDAKKAEATIEER